MRHPLLNDTLRNDLLTSIMLQQQPSDHSDTGLAKRRRKLAEKRRRFFRAVLDFLLFYTTSFFVLLAVFSVFALIFLVPFFIDPAWATLRADFDPEGTTCTTVSGVYKEGEM